MRALPSRDCGHRPWSPRFPEQITFRVPFAPESILQATAALRTFSPPFLAGLLVCFWGLPDGALLGRSVAFLLLPAAITRLLLACARSSFKSTLIRRIASVKDINSIG